MLSLHRDVLITFNSVICVSPSFSVYLIHASFKQSAFVHVLTSGNALLSQCA